MGSLGFLLTLLLTVWANRPSLINYNPVADPRSVVAVAGMRFTVLTERLIRIEQAKNNNSFEDRSTLAVLNRALPVPRFSVDRLGDSLLISTKYLTLNVSVSQGLSSLSIVSNATAPSLTQFSKWKYGESNSQSRNLLGTIRSLDDIGPTTLNCTLNAHIVVHLESLHCEWGLISRDGWALYDDTDAPTLDANDWWNGTNVDKTDLYFFGHGLDYIGAINDYTQIGGKTIMTPKQASGVWWSRWYDVNSLDVQEIVSEYEFHNLPLDVFVLDMDWHKKDSWTGYSWDERLFFFPADTMAFLHAKGLLTTANLHDRFGVASFETKYAQFAQYVGMDPSKGEVVPLNLVNATWAYGLEDIVVKAIEDTGMDFWWLDWQQGELVAGLKGGKQNPTIWMNHIRATNNHRRGSDERAMILARWGGMGSHRYQVGFSGDVLVVDWASLAYQPYFSWTASNVGFGFWSHDVLGPEGYETGKLNNNLYVRWMQWGSWSGVMRSHDRGLSAGLCNDFQPSICGVVEPWKIPFKDFAVVRSALRQRASLLPYIYTAVRQAFDTGLSIIRPMYYYWPQEPMSYAGDMQGNYAQYMFGVSILVAPIVTPQEKTDEMVSKSVWLPPGEWIDIQTGTLYQLQTGLNLTKSFDLRDVPTFVRANTVLPVLPVDQLTSLVGLGHQAYTFLGFDFYPVGPVCAGQTDVYEDDGKTTAYIYDKYAYTTAVFTRQQQANIITTTIKITIKGSYSTLPTRRAYQLRMHNTAPASSVVIVSGEEDESVPYSRFGGVTKGTPTSSSWRWNNFQLIIDVDPRSVSQGLTVLVQEPVLNASLYGLRGMLRNANWAKQNLDEDRKNPGDVGGGATNPGAGYLSLLASSADGLAYLAGVPELADFQTLLARLPDLYTNATIEVGEVVPPPNNPSRVTYSLALLKYAR